MLRGNLSLLLILSLFLCTRSSAQRQIPSSFPFNIDSVFDLCASSGVTDAEKIMHLEKIDAATRSYEESFPVFRGVLHLYQSFYSPAGDIREQHLGKALGLLQPNAAVIADTFSSQFSQLAGYFSDNDRLDEWKPVDSLLRRSLGAKESDPNSFLFVVGNMAIRKINAGKYRTAENWGVYESLIWHKRKDRSIPECTSYLTYSWVITKSRFEQWKATPYYKRDENVSFADNFKILIELTKEYLDSAVFRDNTYSSKPYNRDLRLFYFSLYNSLVMDLADWAINDHREGIAILPLKDFIYQVAIPKELEEAKKAGVSPVLNCNQVRDAFQKLSQLYLNIYNGSEAYNVANRGRKYLYDYKAFPEADRNSAFYYLFYMMPEAQLIAGKYEAALRLNKTRKEFYPKPTRTDSNSMQYWNTFIDVWLMDVAILNAQNNRDSASAVFSQLLDSLSMIDSDSSELLYGLYQWPHLQFAVQMQRDKHSNWKDIRDWMLEALTTLEQTNHWENVNYYYPAQLLYFISCYRTDSTIKKHILYNMLFYTERHLKYTFILLSPQERMRLYEQKLNDFFDLYHEMLFTGQLDKYPEIKEKVIAQSLFLKNALADNNMLPDNIFKTTANLTEFLPRLRRLKMETNLFTLNTRLRGADDKEDNMDDKVQSMWLSFLGDVNTDSIYAANSWKNISASLKPQQVYVEAVRYTNRLSDSSVNYGAYIINASGNITAIPLFSEAKLVSLIKDPSASPQNASIAANNTRGLTIGKAQKEANAKKFKPGDVDRLGEYILSPLWQYISNKKELLIVPDALLNRISLAALQWKNKNLSDHVLIRVLSGSTTLFQPKTKLPANANVLLAGGLDYGITPEKLTRFRLFDSTLSWRYLPGTQSEIDKLQPLFKTAGYNTTTLNGISFPDSSRKILEQYSIIHLATHGFYFDSSLVKTAYSKYVSKEAARQEPLLRCGIAMSFANDPLRGETESNGYLLGGELANTDLRKCYLISLSACETGLGDLRNNLGVDGLTRALKLGGARYLLISLWKVPDAPTAVFMQQFYKELFRLKDPAAALQSTQSFMSKQYSASDWAAFVLVE